MKVVSSVLDLIGNTPMVKLNRVTSEGLTDVYVKCEKINPSGNLKNRVATVLPDSRDRYLSEKKYTT